MSDIIYSVNGDIAQHSESGLYGHIEEVNVSGLGGWLVDLQGASGPLSARILNETVAAGKLDIWRQDLSDIFGLPRTFGFRLSWLPENLKKLAISPDEKYPLLFTFNECRFLVANFPEISGRELKKIIGSLPPRIKTHDARQFGRMFSTAVGDAAPEGDVKLIACYQPRFYPPAGGELLRDSCPPVWARVAQARPFFCGHDQPQIPGELGFYDLRLAETRSAQADLAREYGIYGFCFYYYWHDGHPLWERPLEDTLGSGEPDFPFCICRVNESAANNGQNEGFSGEREMAEAFIESIIPVLLDPRYIHVGDAPILLIDNPASLSDPTSAASAWREACKKYGISSLHLCAVNQAGQLPKGFDSAAQIPPNHGGAPAPAGDIPNLRPGFEGSIFNYEELVRMEGMPPDFMEFPGVMTGWDDTALRGEHASIYRGAAPALYEVWLKAAIERARASLPEGRRLVFINAWNDWGAGAHLEPDARHGRAWLEATRRAFTGQSDWRELLAYARSCDVLAGGSKTRLLAEMEAQALRLDLQVKWYEKLFSQSGPKGCAKIRTGCPPALDSLRILHGGQVCFDQVGNVTDPSLVSAGRGEKLYCSGWGITQSVLLRGNTPTYLLLLAAEEDRILYHGFISRRLERSDIAHLISGIDIECTWNAGFMQTFDLEQVDRGVYRLGLLTLAPAGGFIASSNVRLEVE